MQNRSRQEEWDRLYDFFCQEPEIAMAARAPTQERNNKSVYGAGASR
jgi:hypothetical protein